MKKYFQTMLVFVTIFAASAVYAQTNNIIQQQKTMPILEPVLNVGDLDFTLATLQNVTISGNEVDAYLDVKNKVSKTLKTAVDGGKKADDEITVELKLATANNLIGFMRRANIKGANAERYKRIYDSIIAAANKLNESK